MDYTTLIAAKTTEGSIKNWVNRSDIPATTIVPEAEAWVYEEGMLRVREMVATTVFTFDATLNEEGLPSDFLDPVQYLPYGWSRPLRYVPESSLLDYRDEDGALFTGDPTRWAVVGTTAKIDSAPEAAFTGVLMYYARPAALATTNFITTRYPAMFRHALLARAYSHMKDYERAGVEEQMAMALIQKANESNELFRRGQELN